VALSRLLEHTRRGGCSPLWDALLAAVAARLTKVKAAVAVAAANSKAVAEIVAGSEAGTGAGHDEVQAAVASAARAVDLTQQAVAYFR
jgi:hypothetical protein